MNILIGILLNTFGILEPNVSRLTSLLKRRLIPLIDSKKYLRACFRVPKVRGGLGGASSESCEPVYRRSLACLNDDCGNSVIVDISVSRLRPPKLRTEMGELCVVKQTGHF